MVGTKIVIPARKMSLGRKMVDLVSISIYSNGRRVKLVPDAWGKFLVPNERKSGQSPLVKVTAVDLVCHHKLKHMDPVLTLNDGSKMRVFQGGDPTSLMTMAISICEKHDKKHFKKKISNPKSSKGKRKIITIVDKPSYKGYVSTSDICDDYDYPWCDPSLYDDTD